MRLVDRARGPGERVNVLLVVMMRDGAVGVVGSLDLAAGGAEHVRLGDGHTHVVDAVVRVVLGGGVVLVGVPTLGLVHSSLV